MQLIKVKLTTLPESIGNLTKLTYIVLYDNQLTTLTESIWNLTNLMSEYFKFLPNPYTGIYTDILNEFIIKHRLNFSFKINEKLVIECVILLFL